MSKKKLLLNLLAVSCLANVGANASENQKNQISNAKVSSKSAENKDTNKSIGFWNNNKNAVISSLVGFGVGNITGGIGGYFYGQKGPNAELETVKREKKEANDKITSLQSQIATLSNAQEEINKMKTQLKEEQEKVSQLNAQLQAKILENDKLKSSNTTLQSSLDALKTGDDGAAKQIAGLTDQVNSLKSEKADLETKFNNLKNEKDALEKNACSIDDIRDIIGDDNAKDLATKKDGLKRLFQLGKCLDESMKEKVKLTERKIDSTMFYISRDCQGCKKYVKFLNDNGTVTLCTMKDPNNIKGTALYSGDIVSGIPKTSSYESNTNDAFATPSYRLSAFLPMRGEEWYNDKNNVEAANSFCDFVNWAVYLSDELERKKLFPSDSK